ncbi:MAG: hypothetical protein GX887_05830 [Firmicutes bacterium]|nr:hypothetical protein [Bacillota bacterium]
MARKQTRNFNVIEGEGKSKKPLRGKIGYFVVLGLLLLLLALVGYQWMDSWFYFRRVQITVAEEGAMDSCVSVTGIITRDETVVPSPVTGFILGKIPEGERVSVGGEVVTVIPGLYEPDDGNETGDDRRGFKFYFQKLKTWLMSLFASGEQLEEEENGDIETLSGSKGYESIPVRSPMAGVVSYSIDGLEEKYLSGYPYDLLAPENGEVGQDVPPKKEFVAEGESLFKLVNNWEWFFSVVLEGEEREIMARRKEVNIVFSFFPNEPIQAVLVDMEEEPEARKTYFTYRISRQIPGFTRYRQAEAEINYYTYEGIKIPHSAIIEDEGVTGVYLNDKGIVAYYPVDIIYETDYDVIVDGIPPNSIVIIRPELVKEGQRME